MANKVAKKIYVDEEVWKHLLKQCEVEGISVSEYIAREVMSKVFNIPREVKHEPNLTAIKEHLNCALRYTKIPHSDYDKYKVLYCSKCIRLYLQSNYSIAPYVCVICNDRLVLLGTLNNFL
ncbi:MAG: hypothetical protein QXO37_09495 [Candidatus Nitrosocaldaceae archaeon]